MFWGVSRIGCEHDLISTNPASKPQDASRCLKDLRTNLAPRWPLVNRLQGVAAVPRQAPLRCSEILRNTPSPVQIHQQLVTMWYCKSGCAHIIYIYISYHIISYHIISYHIISLYTLQSQQLFQMISRFSLQSQQVFQMFSRFSDILGLFLVEFPFSHLHGRRPAKNPQTWGLVGGQLEHDEVRAVFLRSPKMQNSWFK